MLYAVGSAHILTFTVIIGIGTDPSLGRAWMLRTLLPRCRGSISTRGIIRQRTPLITRHRTYFMDSRQPLDLAAGPLVWIDCEMTGLDPKVDKILEIAVSPFMNAGIPRMAQNVLAGSHYER